MICSEFCVFLKTFLIALKKSPFVLKINHNGYCIMIISWLFSDYFSVTSKICNDLPPSNLSHYFDLLQNNFEQTFLLFSFISIIIYVTTLPLTRLQVDFIFPAKKMLSYKIDFRKAHLLAENIWLLPPFWPRTIMKCSCVLKLDYESELCFIHVL